MIFTPITFLIGLGSLGTGSTSVALLYKYTQERLKERKLLLFLLQGYLVAEAKSYLDEGQITSAAYAHLYNEVYVPYKELGGNGIVVKLMKDVEKLKVVEE